MSVTAQDLARLAPSGLAALASRGYQRPPHVALLERRLLDLAAGRIRRLRVCLPPRHSKSETVSRFFLAHWLLTNPTKRAILACATAGLAETYSRKVRDLVLEFGHLFGVRIRPDSRAVDRWELVQGGGLIAVGAGSALVGRGAELLVADDVVAGFEAAASKAQLAKIVEWFRRDVYTRLEPGAGCVVVGTRWAELDVHGTLEAEERAGGERWETVILPALCLDPATDPLGRPLGAALWPERYDAGELARIRSAIGVNAFACLYEQRPVPAEGGLFKTAHAKRWVPVTNENGVRFCRLEGGEEVSQNVLDKFLTVDTAVTDASEKNAARADFTAIAVWGANAGRLVLLDLDLRRIDGAKIADAIKAMSKRYEGAVAWIEETTMSKHLLAFLAREQVIFKTTKPDKSKLARAIPASALMEQGRIFLPESGPSAPAWLTEFEHQLFSFTGGAGGAAHDDCVDVTSMAVQVLGEVLTCGGFGDATAPPPPREADVMRGYAVPSPPGWAPASTDPRTPSQIPEGFRAWL